MSASASTPALPVGGSHEFRGARSSVSYRAHQSASWSSESGHRLPSPPLPSRSSHRPSRLPSPRTRRRRRLRRHAHAVIDHIPDSFRERALLLLPWLSLPLCDNRSSLEAGDSGARNPSDPASAAPLRHGCGAMVRGLAPALRGRAAAAARWCTCRRVAVAVCLGNLAAALLVARALYAPGTFASAPKRTPRLLSSLLPPLAVSIKLIRRLGSCLWFQAGRRSIPRSR